MSTKVSGLELKLFNETHNWMQRIYSTSKHFFDNLNWEQSLSQICILQACR